jgi:pimeloyl-ACP methyl ester carboxylesterase
MKTVGPLRPKKRVTDWPSVVHERESSMPETSRHEVVTGRWFKSRRTAVVAVAVGALAVTVATPMMVGASTTGPAMAKAAFTPSNPAAVKAAAQIAAVPTPKLMWKPCTSEPKYQCTTVSVPLDYDHPRGASITLSGARRPAKDQAHRLGSLFVLPGGPGDSGVEIIASGQADAAYTPAVRDRFDIVSFDPRGIAASTGVQCFDSRDEAAANRPPFGFPYTRKQERQLFAADRALSQACVKRAGAIIDHMSTANVARDLDLLRRAVGDKQLTYAGFSYGTFVGQTYANLFPGNVRAGIIDGVVDPILWSTGRGGESQTEPVWLDPAQGSAETFQQFLTLCKRGGTRCAFSAGDPGTRFAALTARLLKSGPITLPPATPKGKKVQVAYQDLVQTVLRQLYFPAAWPVLATFLDGMSTGSLREAAAALAILAPPATPETTSSQTLEGLTGVFCSDADNPATLDARAKEAREADRRVPYFGRAWAWNESACAYWPGQDDDRYTGPFNTVTANPLLVINNRYDPPTPYASAVRASKILPGSRLLTVNGWGHVTALTGSECANRYAATYLLTGVLPPEGTVCAPNEVPFAAPSKK